MIKNKSELNVRGLEQMSLAQTRIIKNIFLNYSEHQFSSVKEKNKQINKYQRSTALSGNFKTVTEDTLISFMVDWALNLSRK